MATYTKFRDFVEDIAHGVHNLSSDQIAVALSNSDPTVSAGVLSSVSQVSYTNCSSRNVITSSSSQTTGTYSLVLTDLTLSASGGTVGAFQYVVLYNDTATNDELIGYYDYGSSITLQDGETFKLDFGATTITIT